MDNFAIYLENGFITIRIYDNITRHRIFTYIPYTKSSKTIYAEFETLYDRMNKNMDQYSFTMIDEDNYITNLSYQKINDKNILSFISFYEDSNVLKSEQSAHSARIDVLKSEHSVRSLDRTKNDNVDNREYKNYSINDEDMIKIKNFLGELKSYLQIMLYVSFY
jgi:hypothetical protein